MRSRLAEVLLALLVIMVGVSTLLHIHAANRMQFVLQNILAEVQDLPDQTVVAVDMDESGEDETDRQRTTEVRDPEPVAEAESMPAPEAEPAATAGEPESVHNRTAQAAADETDADAASPSPAADNDTQPELTATPSAGADGGKQEASSQQQASAATVTEPTEPAEAVEPAEPIGDAMWQRVGPTMKQIVGQLLAGEYEPVFERFDERMATNVPLDYLAQVMDDHRQRTGDMRSVIDQQRIRFGVPEGHVTYQVTVATEKDHPLIFTITLDRAMRISGLFVKPADAAQR